MANSRGLTTGRFSTRDGELVASAAELVGILNRGPVTPVPDGSGAR